MAVRVVTSSITRLRQRPPHGATPWRHIYSLSFITDLYKALTEITNLPGTSSLSGRVTASFQCLFWVISRARAQWVIWANFSPSLWFCNCRGCFLISPYVGGFAFLEKDQGPWVFAMFSIHSLLSNT